VVRALRRSGRDVRAFVRDPQKARRLLGGDVALAVGDFADGGSVRTALEGVEEVVLSCADDPRRVEWENDLIDATAAGRVRRLAPPARPDGRQLDDSPSGTGTAASRSICARAR
jgi:uncharacterized protein YbjT (DUF2867 family)